MQQQSLSTSASAAAPSAVPPAYSQLGTSELQALLAKRQTSNAMKTRELDEMELALEHMESRVASFAVATPVLEMESTALQEKFDKNQKHLQILEASVADLRNRLRETQELLEMREAEVSETEDAVRTFDNRERARQREISSTARAIKDVEDGLRNRQRELLRLERTRDSEATAAWWSSHQGGQSSAGAPKRSGQAEGQGGARQPRPRPAPGFAVLDEADEGDAAALKLRAARLNATSAGADPGQADFAQFHSLALSIKVTLLECPRMQRTRSARRTLATRALLAGVADLPSAHDACACARACACAGRASTLSRARSLRSLAMRGSGMSASRICGSRREGRGSHARSGAAFCR